MINHNYDLETEEGVRAACADPRFLFARAKRIGGPCYSIVFRDHDSPSCKRGIGLVDEEFAHLIPCTVSPTECA